MMAHISNQIFFVKYFFFFNPFKTKSCFSNVKFVSQKVRFAVSVLPDLKETCNNTSSCTFLIGSITCLLDKEM